jgi:hypothetical protein
VLPFAPVHLIGLIEDALQVAEKWSGGAAVSRDELHVHGLMMDRLSLDHSHALTEAASLLMRLTTTQATGLVPQAASRVANFAVSAHYTNDMNREMAAVIREHLPVVTLDDLIRAGLPD